MAEKEPSVRYDQRTLKHHLRTGAITYKEYDSYLKSLSDSESNADYIELYEEEQEGDESSGLTFSPAESSD